MNCDNDMILEETEVIESNCPSRTALYHRPHIRTTIPILLATRQQYGNLIGRRQYHRGSCVTSKKLCSAIAWNPTRMNNMVLSVGPGTPASSSIVNNDDDDEDEDDGQQSGDTRIDDSDASQEGGDDEEEEEEEGDDVEEDLEEKKMKTEEDEDCENSTDDNGQEEEEEKNVARSRTRGNDDGGESEEKEADSDSDDNGGGERELSGRAKWLLSAIANRVEEAADEEQEQRNQQARIRRFREREGEGDDQSEIEEEEGNHEVSTGVVANSENVSTPTRSRSVPEPLEMAQRAIMEWMEADAEGDDDEDEYHLANEDDDDDDDDSSGLYRGRRYRRLSQWQRARRGQQQQQQGMLPSAPAMRHGGCINTAVWMSCPWRLSIASNDGVVISSSNSSNDESFLDSALSPNDTDGRGFHVKSVASQDCPTQLITSGDDRVVKFWDVRHAMGTSTPLPGGMNTVCPFSNPTVPSPQITAKMWKKHYKATSSYINSPTTPNMISGMVIPLATLQTGHRGNVFHATPLVHHPGKVATCGADGYLRMTDLERSESSAAASIIVSPEYDGESLNNILPAGLLSLRPGMCFSHHFINANTGLLCSERGLRRFDLRLNPREQQTRSILGGPYRTCKACAIWSASASALEDVDSAYVFAGGSSGDVALYDLRMTGGSGSKVVQHYRPRGIGPDASVSVSGLDISRDKRELLVSYENDQIYTFPIFPAASSAAGPTVDELAALSLDIDGDDDETTVLRELCCYGGHLNRFTFLKNAKYAGPQDEYICTGSDSGHAWIYERTSGSVVSLLNADHSTCNGVVPHPNLPFFVTYGIDSTAKLWRATIPVDHRVDDSPLGRARCFNGKEYDKSPLVGNWKSVQANVSALEDGDDLDTTCPVLPDQIPPRDDELEQSIFESLGSIFFRSRRGRNHGPGGPYIGNNLLNLPEILRQNLFTCIKAQHSGDDEPVKSGLCELKRRISAIRLRHQADQYGLLWDSSVPWIMQAREYFVGKDTYNIIPGGRPTLKSDVRGATMYGQRSDLVPECPSDWIPYDREMTNKPLQSGINFNLDDYEAFYNERYGPSRYSLVTPAAKLDLDNDHSHYTPRNGIGQEKCNAKGVQPNGVVHDVQNGKKTSVGVIQNGRKNETETSSSVNIENAVDVNLEESEHSWKLLHDTALLLKESGNAALQVGAVNIAARRYDKVIRYCAVAFTTYPNGNITFVKRDQASLLSNGGYQKVWRPLLKVFVSTRLNLSMTLLKSEINDASGAAEQAQQALHNVRPFVIKKGRVMMGRKLDQERPGDEPPETFLEAKELQAKAYFRLGTAQYATKDFATAVKSFEQSIKSTKDACESATPESIVVRRLAQAKRENARRKKRQRKKFKLMLAETEGHEEKERECRNGKEKDKS